VMRAIGGLLNDVDNAISLAGHTDAVQYAGGERGYSNWELSADRANASRRELVAGGMKENKILRVVGLGSSLPLDAEDPLNPMNRRISLVVLNDKTERQIRGLPEEPVEEIQNETDAAQVLGFGEAPTDSPGDTEPLPAAEPDAPPTNAAPAGERLAQPGADRNAA
jgi:chemotaxis protein MotB